MLRYYAQSATLGPMAKPKPNQQTAPATTPKPGWSRGDKIGAFALLVALLALPAAWLAVPDLFSKKSDVPKKQPDSPKQEWVAAGKKSRTKTTGNHHCERNCEGEPTRTNYTIEFDADPGERFIGNPDLKCVSGAGCPYSHANYARIEGNGQRAASSFDVWGHPSTWELSVDTERLQEVRK